MEKLQKKELLSSASNLKGAFNAIYAAERESNPEKKSWTLAEADRLLVLAHDEAEVAFNSVSSFGDKIESTRLRVITLLCRFDCPSALLLNLSSKNGLHTGDNIFLTFLFG